MRFSILKKVSEEIRLNISYQMARFERHLIITIVPIEGHISEEERNKVELVSIFIE